MQLEKYVINLLAKEDDREVLEPTSTESQTIMSIKDNNPSFSQHDGKSSDLQNQTLKYKSGVSVNAKIHKNRLRRCQKRAIGKSIKKNTKASSISLEQYNSLRIMVPSVASNENASRIEVVDEAVRYIKELESTLANKVIHEGGLLLPGMNLFEKAVKQQVIPLIHNRNLVPLEASINSQQIDKNGIHLIENSTQLRNLVNHFVVTPRQRLVHDCTEILKGLNETTISDNSSRKNRE